jgi:hypothetical protein
MSQTWSFFEPRADLIFCSFSIENCKTKRRPQNHAAMALHVGLAREEGYIWVHSK